MVKTKCPTTTKRKLKGSMKPRSGNCGCKRGSMKPKRPLSAYMLFMQDFRKKNSQRGWSVTQMVSKGAEVWNKLSSQEKTPYTETAERTSSEYKGKMQTYKKQNKQSGTKASSRRKEDSSEEDETYTGYSTSMSSGLTTTASVTQSKTEQAPRKLAPPTRRETRKRVR